jgi:hypothetical protein
MRPNFPLKPTKEGFNKLQFEVAPAIGSEKKRDKEQQQQQRQQQRQQPVHKQQASCRNPVLGKMCHRAAEKRLLLRPGRTYLA